MRLIGWNNTAGIRKKSNMNRRAVLFMCIAIVVLLVIGQRQVFKSANTCVTCSVEKIPIDVSSRVHDAPSSLSIRLYTANSNIDELASRNAEIQASDTRNNVLMPNMSTNGSVITKILNPNHNYGGEHHNITFFSSNSNRASNAVLPNTTSHTSCNQLLVRYLFVPIDDKLLSMLPEQCFSTDKFSDKLAKIIDSVEGNTYLENVSCSVTIPNFLEVPRSLVALASSPGSGNTWIRLIVEGVTGIYTGSVYPDTLATFKGSLVCPTSGRVFIIKTHNSGSWISDTGCKRLSLQFSRAMFVIRNPYDALIAEFNRQISNSKTSFAKETHYAGNNWTEFVKSMSTEWTNMTLYWLSKFDKPVHVIVYEELKTRTMLETYRIMKFLNLKVTLYSLYCIQGKSHKKYLRAEKPDWMTKYRLFDQEMREDINTNINSVLDTISKDWNLHSVLSKYILS